MSVDLGAGGRFLVAIALAAYKKTKRRNDYRQIRRAVKGKNVIEIKAKEEVARFQDEAAK